MALLSPALIATNTQQIGNAQGTMTGKACRWPARAPIARGEGGIAKGRWVSLGAPIAGGRVLHHTAAALSEPPCPWALWQPHGEWKWAEQLSVVGL